MEYMAKTNAYREIPNGQDLCLEHFSRVKTLIDPMLRSKAINLKFWKAHMYPKVDRIELAHLYFIPKPHKVRLLSLVLPKEALVDGTHRWGHHCGRSSGR